MAIEATITGNLGADPDVRWTRGGQQVTELRICATPDRRRRDRHNLAPTVKAMMDGLIDAGLLPDDADRYLDGPHTLIADRTTEKILGRPMYEVRIHAYTDTEMEEPTWP